MSSNPTRDKLLLNDEVEKNKKADRTTTAIVHTLRDTHHSRNVGINYRLIIENRQGKDRRAH
jgi:hypothetical protein